MKFTEEADHLFYKDFDPFHFFRVATLLDKARRGPPPDVVAQLGEDILPHHPIATGITEEFAESIGVHIHLLRLQASETLLSILCGGHPHGPFLRFVDQVRYKSLYEIFGDIHNKQVPKRLSLKLKGESITDFSMWLDYKLFGRFDTMGDDPETGAGLVRFLSDEAALCSKRHLINSTHRCWQTCRLIS